MDNRKIKVFDDYSEYYDLLYQDKDYAAEAKYVHRLIKKYSSIPVKNILNIGCGTGNHDIYFTKMGYAVDGIDLSPRMIAIAKTKTSAIKNIHFSVGDAKKIFLHKKFDAVLSLFHTMCYQTANRDLIACFKNAFRHLKKNGLFIFDIWYGPAVLTDKPGVRMKSVKNSSLKIKRKTTPTIFPNENRVDVQFDVTMKNARHTIKMITEHHQVRYLFIPELEHFLSLTGFKLIGITEWMKEKTEPGFNSWNIALIAQK